MLREPRAYIYVRVSLFVDNTEGRREGGREEEGAASARVLERRRLVRRQTMEYVSLLSAGALSCSAVASNLMHIHASQYHVDIGER